MSLEFLLNKISHAYHGHNISNTSGISNFNEISIPLNIKEIFNGTLNLNDTAKLRNWSSQNKLNSILFENIITEWEIILLFFYSLIILVSFFGNSTVCKIIFWNPAMRSTTNIYIGNLAVSDLLTTVLNVPMQLTQILCRNWPLGKFLCVCLPFWKALPVTASSFTMTCIALDRYKMIIYPLKPRLNMTSIILKLIFIWFAAIMVSFPYSLISKVQDINEYSYYSLSRCKLVYPQPESIIQPIWTLTFTAIQYLVPLLITGFTYIKICIIIWNRRSIGEISERQENERCIAKWKTVKMLIIVFATFAVCWFPLNMYRVYQDFRGVVDHTKHITKLWVFCHCFAMSSICYNPFVYSWLNNNFRSKAKSHLLWLFRIKSDSDHHSNMSLQLSKSNQMKEKLSSKISTISVNNQSQNSYKPRIVNLQNFKLHDRLLENERNFSQIKQNRSSNKKDISKSKSCNAELTFLIGNETKILLK